ncbi:TetR/AcrR family transcriptional regulator [Bacillus sp. A301a_S52]|nr:TetR/AcrR family transcriptional regulator [Bacillus sp. A301a_S52]
MTLPLSDKAKNTKRKILQAAKELMLKKSIDKTTINDIVEKAGVAKGTFYLYFESKEELAWSFIEEGAPIFNLHLEQLRYKEVCRETIDSFIDDMVAFCIENRQLFKIIHHVKFLEFIHFEKKQSQFESLYISHIKTFLDRGVEKGTLVIPDTGFYANFIFISLHELIEGMVLNDDDSLHETKHKIKEIIHRLLRWEET